MPVVRVREMPGSSAAKPSWLAAFRISYLTTDFKDLTRRIFQMEALQYLSDESGKRTAVVVPIEIWQELMAERETAYLLKSETMKQRLLQARRRNEGVTLEDAREALGI
jgi:hypothetical protein